MGYDLPRGYYIMLGFHAMGLPCWVGAVMVIDLRLLGFFKERISLVRLRLLIRSLRENPSIWLLTTC